jgi:hypothetical protein
MGPSSDARQQAAEKVRDHRVAEADGSGDGSACTRREAAAGAPMALRRLSS